MGAYRAWSVSDALWERVEPLIPQRVRPKRKKYQRREGGGRKPMDPRMVFEAIVYILRTGGQWKSLPKTMGSASSVHKYHLQWKKAGFYTRLWRLGLAEVDELAGIAWSWNSVDCSMVKAPLAREAVGANPTDRGKKGDKAQSHRRRSWNPVVGAPERRERPRFKAADSDNPSIGDAASKAQGSASSR